MTDIPDLFQGDRAHTSLYTDPEIFDTEMERIFYRTWVWVAHESEIPDPGDYLTTHVGLQPVIVNRDRDGEIQVHVNRCRHRSAALCSDRRGNAKNFPCPYHGWVYGLRGDLRGVPYPDSYGPDFKKEDYPLRSLRVETYAGLVFATFAREGESLREFLGDAAGWIDLFMKQGAGFPVRVAGEHRFRFPGNWKIQLENTTDAYHFPVVHRSFLDSLDAQTEDLFSFLRGDGYVRSLGNGHSVMVMIPELVDLESNLDAPIPDRFAGLADTLRRDYDEDRVRRIVRAVGGTGFNLNLFPNLACSLSFFRVLRPISVEETEIRHVALGMGGQGPPAANRMRLRLHEHFQGPMGFGTTDDAEVWDRVQRGARGGPDLWILLNRGRDAAEAGRPGSQGDVSAETGMRAAYRMWQRMMTP